MTRRPLVVARAACVVLAVVVGVGACAAPRNTRGTSSSPCFRALPTARAAVHHRGRLVGVRRVTRDKLLHAFPSADPPPGRSFCLVGFTGSYRAEDVDHAAGAPTGHHAVVTVTVRGTTVLRTFVVDRLPLSLHH